MRALTNRSRRTTQERIRDALEALSHAVGEPAGHSDKKGDPVGRHGRRVVAITEWVTNVQLAPVDIEERKS